MSREEGILVGFILLLWMILSHLAAAAKLVLPRRHLGQRVGAQPVHNVTHAQLPVARRPEPFLPGGKNDNCLYRGGLADNGSTHTVEISNFKF